MEPIPNKVQPHQQCTQTTRDVQQCIQTTSTCPERITSTFPLAKLAKEIRLHLLHRQNVRKIFKETFPPKKDNYFAEPIPKPRLNVSLSSSDETKKKRPVPQPRSLASKSTSKLVSMTSEVHPVPSANVRIFKKYHVNNDPPLPSPPIKTSSASSSSGEEEDERPPALPARSSSSRKPYYMSDVQD